MNKETENDSGLIWIVSIFILAVFYFTMCSEKEEIIGTPNNFPIKVLQTCAPGCKSLCKDGTCSKSKGRGTCSSHGGVMRSCF